MTVSGIIIAKRGDQVDVKTSIGVFTVHMLQTELETTPMAFNDLEQKLTEGYQSAILTNKYDKSLNHNKYASGAKTIFYGNIGPKKGEQD